jgi:hypothetical protein
MQYYISIMTKRMTLSLETITVGGKPEDNSDNNNTDDDNDDERATSDGELTNGRECPRNQEGPFTPCMPDRACSEDISVLGIPILPFPK